MLEANLITFFEVIFYFTFLLFCGIVFLGTLKRYRKQYVSIEKIAVQIRSINQRNKLLKDIYEVAIEKEMSKITSRQLHLYNHQRRGSGNYSALTKYDLAVERVRKPEYIPINLDTINVDKHIDKNRLLDKAINLVLI